MRSVRNRLTEQVGQRLQLSPLRRAVKNAVPTLAERVLSHSWVENRVLRPRYQAYLSHHQAQQRSLFDTDSFVVDQLRDRGQCVTTLTELAILGQESFFQSGQQLFQTLEQRVKSDRVKFQATPDFSLLKAHAQIFQWGLNSRLLGIAESYFGLPVAYDTCLCNISVGNGLETATRRWHLDNEDRCVLKVIIYFNDVAAGGGPFQCLDPESSQTVLAAAGDRCAFFISQTFEALVQSQVPTAAPQTCTGPAGTVIFVDTAKVYHRGQPPVSQSRRAITFGYCSRRPQRPFRCSRNQLSRSQLNQLAEGLSDEQKACIFWQDELPQWVRRIPTYTYG